MTICCLPSIDGDPPPYLMDYGVLLIDSPNKA
jgi:hypothetical protein